MGRGRGGYFVLHLPGPIPGRRRLGPGDGIRGDEVFRVQIAAVALDYHGAREAQVAVEVAHGEVQAIVVMLVSLVALRVESLKAGVAVNGPQAAEPGGEIPNLIIAMAACHGLVGDDQFVGVAGLPPGQQGHGFALVAGIDRPEKGHRLEQQCRGQWRAAKAHLRFLGSQPGYARRGHHGLEERGAFHQKEALAGEEVVDGLLIRRGKILVFQVNGQHSSVANPATS
jgi:hypothetical protein